MSLLLACGTLDEVLLLFLARLDREVFSDILRVDARVDRATETPIFPSFIFNAHYEKKKQYVYPVLT